MYLALTFAIITVFSEYSLVYIGQLKQSLTLPKVSITG